MIANLTIRTFGFAEYINKHLANNGTKLTYPTLPDRYGINRETIDRTSKTIKDRQS